MKKHYRLWLFPAVNALLLLLVLLTNSNRELFHFLNHAATFANDGFWAHITLLGNTLVALTLVFAFVYRYPALVWAAVIAAILAALCIHGLKPLFDIARPAAILAPETFHIIGKILKKGSFPSGHATTAITLAALVFLHLRSPLFRIAAIAAGLLVGFSRIAVGAHWPADVLAGFILGWLCAVSATWLERRWPWGISIGGQRVLAFVFGLCAIGLLFYDQSGYPGTDAFRIFIALSCLAAGFYGAWHQSRQAPS